MADADINPFSNHDKTNSHHDENENIPLTPGEGGIGGSTWRKNSRK